MPIIDASYYPQVRAVLDVSIDENVLSDSIIALPVYQHAGEAEVIRKLPTWETFTGDDAIAIRNAAVYEIAALLALALPAITREQTTDGQSYQRTVVEPEALAAALRARADIELGIVIDDGDPLALIPTMFDVAPATLRRRRRSWGTG